MLWRRITGFKRWDVLRAMMWHPSEMSREEVVSREEIIRWEVIKRHQHRKPSASLFRLSIDSSTLHEEKLHTLQFCLLIKQQLLQQLKSQPTKPCHASVRSSSRKILPWSMSGPNDSHRKALILYVYVSMCEVHLSINTTTEIKWLYKRPLVLQTLFLLRSTYPEIYRKMSRQNHPISPLSRYDPKSTIHVRLQQLWSQECLPLHDIGERERERVWSVKIAQQ